MKTIILTYEENPPTGAIQFGDNWPGLYVKGDEALYLSGILEKCYMGKKLDYTDRTIIAELVRVIQEEVKVSR